MGNVLPNKVFYVFFFFSFSSKYSLEVLRKGVDKKKRKQMKVELHFGKNFLHS